MSILAQISDLHLLERDHHKRRGYARKRLQFLSTGAPLDAEARLQRALTALQKIRRVGVDHVLITGDLTEDGDSSQFEALGELLDRSGIDPSCVTIVPGNHDGYGEPGAYARALEGPLRAFKKTSAEGVHTVLDDVLIIPVSTMIDGQWFTRSRGAVRHEDVLHVRRLASDPISRSRAVVVAQHHPPSHHAVFAWEWIDGVTNALAMRDLVLERTRVHVLHGHVHRRTTKHFSGRMHAQVFSTSSLRDQHDSDCSLRFYEAEDGVLRELIGALPVPQPSAAHGLSGREAFSLVAT
jgi:3',5'-cyclic AMP phosphodiesterase CpdA